MVAPDVRRWGSVAAPADFLDNPIAPRKVLAAPTIKLFHHSHFGLTPYLKWMKFVPFLSLYVHHD